MAFNVTAMAEKAPVVRKVSSGLKATRRHCCKLAATAYWDWSSFIIISKPVLILGDQAVLEGFDKTRQRDFVRVAEHKITG
jgi:hypothetical protein